MGKNINRIKVVLADKNKTNKWLAEQLQKDPGTVSKWCKHHAAQCRDIGGDCQVP